MKKYKQFKVEDGDNGFNMEYLHTTIKSSNGIYVNVVELHRIAARKDCKNLTLDELYEKITGKCTYKIAYLNEMKRIFNKKLTAT